jgi:uncharacterized cofD-like protein
VNLRRWLTPGIGIKRWMLLVFVGLLFLALAFAYALRQATRDLEPGSLSQQLFDLLTLSFLPPVARVVVVAGIGLGCVAIGSVMVIRAFMDPFRSGGGRQPLVEVIYQKRFLSRGPRIVAIGGGTGLSALLRGLKEHTSNLTAVVTVADDGGSSGVLRNELGIPPVGDIRNCIAALADSETMMDRVLQYRFPDEGAGVDGQSLGGHAVGNLLIAAMTALEDGDFEEGVRRINRILAVRGQVVPATATPLTLHARLTDGRVVDGQSLIMRTSGIAQVWLSPADVEASTDALEAIADAELIVLGPGSLFTSLLPSLLIPDIRDAVAAASAARVYVCNVATQAGETAGFDLAAHLEALSGHAGAGIVDVVLANTFFDARIPDDWSAEPVRLRWPPSVEPVPRLVLEHVVDPGNAHHHDPERLATALMAILERESRLRRRTVSRTA